MNLFFKGHGAEFVLTEKSPADEEESVPLVYLIGLSEMHKDDESTSPTSDMYSIDYDAAELMRRVPLWTRVQLIPADRFTRYMTNRAYTTDWLGKESETEPPSVEAIAKISYYEAEPEGKEYNLGHALLNISLKMAVMDLSPASAFLRALQNPNLSVSLSLGGIHFTTHERMREKWEIPTLGAFLKSESSAYAGDFNITFLTNGLNSLRDQPLRTAPILDESRAILKEILEGWRL